MSKDSILILVGVMTVLLVSVVDVGAGDRWCATYPEWCVEGEGGQE